MDVNPHGPEPCASANSAKTAYSFLVSQQQILLYTLLRGMQEVFFIFMIFFSGLAECDIVSLFCYIIKHYVQDKDNNDC